MSVRRRIRRLEKHAPVEPDKLVLNWGDLTEGDADLVVDWTADDRIVATRPKAKRSHATQPTSPH